jgi:hypothetical protein
VHLPLQPIGEITLFDVAVLVADVPVAEIVLAQLVSEELDHLLLGHDLFPLDAGHVDSVC